MELSDSSPVKEHLEPESGIQPSATMSDVSDALKATMNVQPSSQSILSSKSAATDRLASQSTHELNSPPDADIGFPAKILTDPSSDLAGAISTKFAATTVSKFGITPNITVTSPILSSPKTFLEPKMHPPTTLDTLPNELLTNVMQFVREKDILAMRHVCKQIHALATPHFGSAYFASLHVMMSQDSFQRLLDICADPVLGPFVRFVTLSPRRLITEAAIYYATDAERFWLTAEETVSQMRLFLSLCDEQRSFEESGQPLQLLAAALTHVNRLNHSVGLGIHESSLEPNTSRLDSAPQTSRSCVMKRCGNALRSKNFYDALSGHEARQDYEMSRTLTLELLLAATSQTHCPFHHFSIILGKQWNTKEIWQHGDTDPMGAFNFPDLDKLTMGQAFGSLLSAQLQYHFDPQEQAPYTFYALNEMVSLAPHLQRLSLKMGDYDGWELRDSPSSEGHDPLVSLADKLMSDDLRELDLSLGQGHEKDFIRLLERHSAKLRTLKIREFAIGDGEEWSHVVEFIHSKLTLESISLESLSQDGSSISMDVEDSPNECDCSFSGETEVEKGLQDLLIFWARDVAIASESDV